MRLPRQMPCRAAVPVLLLWLGLALPGCSDTPTDLAGTFRPEISNEPDSFSLVATDVTDVITTRSYTWSNSGTRATVGFTETIRNGTLNVVIEDGAGTRVYNKALTRDVTEPTSAGVAGDWTIILTLGNLSGTFAFTADTL